MSVTSATMLVPAQDSPQGRRALPLLRPLLEDGWIATCGIVGLEVLYSARRLGDYEATLQERRSLAEVPITPGVIARAIDTQHGLARRGQHRVPIPDLLIAAAAESANLIVLHDDSDFELIAQASEDHSRQPVLPAPVGSLVDRGKAPSPPIRSATISPDPPRAGATSTIIDTTLTPDAVSLHHT